MWIKLLLACFCVSFYSFLYSPSAFCAPPVDLVEQKEFVIDFDRVSEDSLSSLDRFSELDVDSRNEKIKNETIGFLYHFVHQFGKSFGIAERLKMPRAELLSSIGKMLDQYAEDPSVDWVRIHKVAQYLGNRSKGERIVLDDSDHPQGTDSSFSPSHLSTVSLEKIEIPQVELTRLKDAKQSLLSGSDQAESSNPIQVMDPDLVQVEAILSAAEKIKQLEDDLNLIEAERRRVSVFRWRTYMFNSYFPLLPIFKYNLAVGALQGLELLTLLFCMRCPKENIQTSKDSEFDRFGICIFTSFTPGDMQSLDDKCATGAILTNSLVFSIPHLIPHIFILSRGIYRKTKSWYQYLKWRIQHSDKKDKLELRDYYLQVLDENFQKLVDGLQLNQFRKELNES